MRTLTAPLYRALAGVMLTAAVSSAQPTPRVEVAEATVADLQDAMQRGRATSVSITRAYLARIAAYDQAGPRLNAIIRVNPRALAEATQRDAERKAGKTRGPLHGIPVILKDNYDTGDLPTSAGSLALATSQPARDAFVVQRLRDAGAIVLAKANMHELAAGITNISSLGGQTRNPYDPARCPGGSSGGTGAAIAASFATIGWGSDTCGSIRIPSAFGALVGLRATMGLVSRSGIVPLSHSQDIGGPLARTVRDLALALDVSVGEDPTDSTTIAAMPRFRAGGATSNAPFTEALGRATLQGARIGVFAPYFRDTDPEIADSVRAALAVMRARGATIVDMAMPEFDTLLANTSVINMETKHDLAAYLATVPNAPVRTIGDIVARGQFDRELEVRFRSADTFPALPNAAHTTTLARQAALRARMQYLLDSLQLDAVAYPTVRQKPVFPGLVQPGSTCPLGAQSGLPSIAMPVGFTSDGLPVSIELLGKAFSDVRLVQFAYAFEQVAPRRRAPSTTPALVNGVAPAAMPVIATLRAGAATATARITVDEVRNELRWQVTSATPQAISAVVLRRRGGGVIAGPASGTAGSAPAIARMTIPDHAQRVVARLMGPGARAASGSLPLAYADRVAFARGDLSVQLLDARGGVTERVVR
jgi:Asp-tRNA(Asn)/Glu-tRNA(Gln) amidotransferase A subunit family amidase